MALYNLTNLQFGVHSYISSYADDDFDTEKINSLTILSKSSYTYYLDRLPNAFDYMEVASDDKLFFRSNFGNIAIPKSSLLSTNRSHPSKITLNSQQKIVNKLIETGGKADSIRILTYFSNTILGVLYSLYNDLTEFVVFKLKTYVINIPDNYMKMLNSAVDNKDRNLLKEMLPLSITEYGDYNILVPDKKEFDKNFLYSKMYFFNNEERNRYESF